MHCINCGEQLADNANFCTACGNSINKTASNTGEKYCRIGYSEKINDPVFAKYIKNTNRWAVIFSLILAAAAVIGFYIAGEMGADGMENPQALYIGLGIGSMFIVIALFTVIARKRSRTWDGVVIDKTVKKKSRVRSSGDEDYTQYYTEYTVIIRQDNGKKHRLTAEDDDTIFNYYQIGEKVRHHAGLNSYEKYDKTRDSIIFCSACGTLCDISDDYCFRCKCPLLK